MQKNRQKKRIDFSENLKTSFWTHFRPFWPKNPRTGFSFQKINRRHFLSQMKP